MAHAIPRSTYFGPFAAFRRFRLNAIEKTPDPSTPCLDQPILSKESYSASSPTHSPLHPKTMTRPGHVELLVQRALGACGIVRQRQSRQPADRQR
jgi:hypothetical protein